MSVEAYRISLKEKYLMNDGNKKRKFRKIIAP